MPKTDNSFFMAKVNLRMNHLPDKEEISVLDAFGGEGLIWDHIEAHSGKKIRLLRIDQRNDLKGIYLHGDNRKFISSLALGQFDILDLDAYGVCFDMLDYVITFDSFSKAHHRVFLTFIQSQYGRLPQKMLLRLGYSMPMINKIPTLFSRDGIEQLKDYLGLMGIGSVYLKSFATKHYLFFET